MKLKIAAPAAIRGDINLPFSKSISNRVLMINKLCNNPYRPTNIAECDDTRIMQKSITLNDNRIDTGSAGTATRFMTALLAITPGKWELTGSERMKQRPIGILAEVLKELGADIEYTGEKGFLPLAVNGKELTGGEVEVNGGISSQYISAILMIAPYTQKGITIKFKGEVISRPYIQMTLSLMKRYGINAEMKDNTIEVPSGKYTGIPYTVEADWSAASYWYGISSLMQDADIILEGLDYGSIQGDSRVASLFVPLGVATEYNDGCIRLRKCNFVKKHYAANLSDTPDLAQTIAVAAALKGCPFTLSGLQSLRIKETDRITALINELGKLGYKLQYYDGTLSWDGTLGNQAIMPEIATYDDHRMAMAFSLASLVRDDIVICDAEVVSKSYPGYWNDLRQVGFKTEEV